MVFALICDIHMPDGNGSVQQAFLQMAVNQIKEDNIENIITLGDITSFGEMGAFKKFLDCTNGFDNKYILGNSDVRDTDTSEKFINNAEDFKIVAEGINVYGINVWDSKISSKSRVFIKDISDGDILMLHYSMQGLEEESRAFMEKLAAEKKLTIVHGHSHRLQNYTMGISEVRGLRALDADKSIGDFPCITYLHIEDNKISFEEKSFGVSADTIKDITEYLGISCVDNINDMRYAIDNGVKRAELRTNGADWQPDTDEILPLIEKWRNMGGKYLSVHMPNLKWSDDTLQGVEQWMQAVEYAKAVKADGLTMHPPRVKNRDIKDDKIWNEFLKLYVYAVEGVGEGVKVGIENLHMSVTEKTSKDYSFGYIPEEVSKWIDAINEKTSPGRVGHLLDVGHARSNGVYAQMYPISKWYYLMGQKTVAYHIHQVVPVDYGTKNHNAIENWFGPLINYTSFFYAWENQMINHGTVFLEVKGAENHHKSVAALESIYNRY